MPIRIGGSGLLLALSLVAARANATEPPPPIFAQLDYLAPRDRCPPERALRKEVALRLGYDTFTADAPMRVVAAIEHQGHTLAGEIAVFTGAKKEPWSKSFRVGEGACAALLVKMGIAISFYLDPLIFSPAPLEQPRSGDPPKETSTRPDAALASMDAGKREPLKPPKETPRTSFVLSLGPALGIGASGPAFGVVGHAGLRWSMLSIGLSLRYDAQRSVKATAPFEEARVGASALGGSLVPCVHVADFLGCGVLSAGRIFVGVSGLEVRRDRADRPYFGTGLRVGFERRFLPWLGLRLHGEALFMRRTFDIETGGDALRVPTPLASRVNGSIGASLLTYLSL